MLTIRGAQFSGVTVRPGTVLVQYCRAMNGSRTVARNFILGMYKRAGVGNFFLNFCFEMVHFGTKVTNAVHRHWFSGGYSENTDLRLIKFLAIISGGG